MWYEFVSWDHFFFSFYFSKGRGECKGSEFVVGNLSSLRKYFPHFFIRSSRCPGLFCNSSQSSVCWILSFQVVIAAAKAPRKQWDIKQWATRKMGCESHLLSPTWFWSSYRGLGSKIWRGHLPHQACMAQGSCPLMGEATQTRKGLPFRMAWRSRSLQAAQLFLRNSQEFDKLSKICSWIWCAYQRHT